MDFLTAVRLWVWAIFQRPDTINMLGAWMIGVPALCLLAYVFFAAIMAASWVTLGFMGAGVYLILGFTMMMWRR